VQAAGAAVVTDAVEPDAPVLPDLKIGKHIEGALQGTSDARHGSHPSG
jgi:hypothetical protein